MSRTADERANLELTFAADPAGVTRLSRRYARYPWALTRPFWTESAPAGMASVIPQSSSGLLLPGDHFTQSLSLEEGASAYLTSQGAQAVHGTPGGAQSQTNWSLSLAGDSYLELILDPIILFPYSALAQAFHIVLEEGARLVLSEGMTWHPEAHDPQFERFAASLDLRNGTGGLRLREKSLQRPDQLHTIAAASGRMPCAAGQFWLLFGSACPSDDAVPLFEDPAVYAAASRLPDRAGFLLRFLTYDATAFARYQRRLWRSLRQSLVGQAPTDRRRGG